MKFRYRALDAATPQTVRRLGLLSLLLVFVLTLHGAWLLHTMVRAQWEQEAQGVASVIADQADLVFVAAALALEGVETALDEGYEPSRPPPWPALGDSARVVLLLRTGPTGSDERTLAALEPAALFQRGKGSTRVQFGQAQHREPAEYFVWKELAAKPLGVARIAIAIPQERMLRARQQLLPASTTLQTAQVQLLERGAPAADGFAQDGEDIVHRQSLARTNLVAEVRLSHRLVAETLDAHTMPLLVVIFAGTALLVATLLVLLRVTTRHLREAQELKDARALAQVAHRSKGALHAAVSHELTLPLGGIVSVAKLLQANMHRADAYRLVSAVHLGARGLQTVVADILKRSVDDSLAGATTAVATDPVAIGTEVVDLFYASAIARDIELTHIASLSRHRVLIDAFALRQVLANLVGNAVKFTVRGGVTLSSTVSQDGVRPGEYVRLRYEVRDTGCGIEADKLETIFRPQISLQPDPAPGRDIHIGLAMTCRLVRQLGGELEVQSTPGSGSHFWFELELPAAPSEPAASAEPPVPPEPAPAPQTMQTAQRPQSGARILVVEDNPLSAMVVQTQLQSLGHPSDVAADGEDALVAMAAGGYDLVLMDCTLPGLSGQDVTRRWRDFERQSGAETLPIVALTAKSMGVHMQQCLDAGMSDFLAKPCPAQVLGQTLDKWLQSDLLHDAPD